MAVLKASALPTVKKKVWNIYNKVRLSILSVILLVAAVVFLFPLILTITNSFMSASEITANYYMIDGSASSSGELQYAVLKFIPDMVSISQYYQVLVSKTTYLVMFWNSVILCVPIVAGQIFVSALAAYAFSRLNFKGRDTLFFVYIAVMLMPYQVTLVPNYLVNDFLGLINTRWSIILPGIFAPFGVFLVRQFMCYLPGSYDESAKIDGASHFRIFWSIILPLSKSAIAALTILLFIDNWNMVEQPLLFLKDENLRPLSVFLSNINSSERGVAFASSVVYMMPMLLLFLYGENYLVKGIQLSGLK